MSPETSAGLHFRMGRWLFQILTFLVSYFARHSRLPTANRSRNDASCGWNFHIHGKPKMQEVNLGASICSWD